ncbi:hypothetical protein EDB60_11980 [Vibrio crassostreae]|nr:hypothetical protein EDB33_12010 [Vibrio crassostreae]ROP15401.1 hypothetical protein EDB34_12080 [Vibrio crassostreae]RPE88820.1 hypothetical protein EDB15_1209 [Vibrio crassostreae]TCN63013.1 hypothetical protein EDB60_11980 [Vibrio crassostreae]TCV13781.1 hypothetical protein EDB16_10480 [Vibrio crassostreae]
MNSKTNTFELFRYQILPIDRYFQGDFFNGVHSVEELIAQKNHFFAEALLGQNDFSNNRHKTIVKLIPNSTAKCDTLQYQAATAISLKIIAGCLKSKHFFGR